MTNRSNANAPRTIGLDLGDKSSHFTIRDAAGEVLKRGRLATTPEAFESFFAEEQGTRVAYEASTHSPWITWLLKDLGSETLVANTRQLALISKSVKKTDRRDADLISDFACFRPRLLSPIEHNGPEAHAHRAALTVRAALVTARTKFVNVARGLVKSLGGRFPKCTAASFHNNEPRGRLHPAALEALKPLLATIRELSQKIRKADRELERLATELYPVTNVLRQVTGVGAITALAFVLRIEDPHRFAKSRDVGGYLGLVPKKRQSGDSDPELRITKAGDPFLRTMLVQASQYILGPFAPDTDLRRFGERLTGRGRKADKRRAVIAVARKLAVLLHRLWITGEVYEPLRNSQRQSAA